MTLSLRNPSLWFATVLACVGAAYLVARADSQGDRQEGQAAESPPESPPPAAQLPGSSRVPGSAKTATIDSSDESGGSGPAGWLAIPKHWMEHFRPGPRRRETHTILGLTYQEGERMEKAMDACLAAAAKEQIAGIDDFVLSEGEVLKLPALSDGSIRALVGEVVAILPEGSRAIHEDFLGFLVERDLRKDYGHDLEVSLEYSGAISTIDIRHLPGHLLGFHYVVRKAGAPETESPEHHMVGGSGRFHFLRVDPAVTNKGRSELER